MRAGIHIGLLVATVLALGGMAKASLKVGDTAPDFALPDQSGATVKLSDFRGKKTVVLAFYIKAFTSGWTRELKAYQADIAKFEAADAKVLGISVDSREQNKAFAESLGVTFPILSDEQKTVSRRYDVLIPLLRLAHRVTFVIDRQGIIRQIIKGGDAIDPSGGRRACAMLEKGQVKQ
jgi:peroxiredoxin Q/BCP